MSQPGNISGFCLDLAARLGYRVTKSGDNILILQPAGDEEILVYQITKLPEDSYWDVWSRARDWLVVEKKRQDEHGRYRHLFSSR